eukprot:10901956-Alexandrium_andersonii.AAC.1
MQHLAVSSIARSAGRPPDRPRSTWWSLNSARTVPSTGAACSTRSRRSKSLGDAAGRLNTGPRGVA